MTAVEPRSESPPRSDRVLVAAPFRRDAELLRKMLLTYGIDATICADTDALADGLAIDGAALVLSQEALTERLVDVVAGHLAAQPNWSELPLVMLLDADHQDGSVLARLRARLPSSKMMALQRPVRTLELVTAVQTALAARRRQFQLRDQMIWQEELQRELSHRVKNVLANVNAIYHMTLRQSGSLPDFAAAFEGRLSALSKVHGAVVASGEPQALMDIADMVLDPYRSTALERVVLDGPRVAIAPTHAVTLALCLHELATNAAKYGALSTSWGTVSLTWALRSAAGGHVVELMWTETGGPPIIPSSRRGYGTRFVRAAATGSLAGAAEFDFRPEGLVCKIIVASGVIANVAPAFEAAPN